MEAVSELGALCGLLDVEGVDVPDGFVTVLVAPANLACAEFGECLRTSADGVVVRVLTLHPDGHGTCDGETLAPGDEAGWDGFASRCAAENVVVLVDGPLADAAATASRFVPAFSLTDGGSMDEARARLSAAASKARLVSVSNTGSLGALLGGADVPDHAALSDLVARIVGYAWRLDGRLVANEARLYPDGLDKFGEAYVLVDPDEVAPSPRDDSVN